MYYFILLMKILFRDIKNHNFMTDINYKYLYTLN